MIIYGSLSIGFVEGDLKSYLNKIETMSFASLNGRNIFRNTFLCNFFYYFWMSKKKKNLRWQWSSRGRGCLHLKALTENRYFHQIVLILYVLLSSCGLLLTIEGFFVLPEVSHFVRLLAISLFRIWEGGQSALPVCNL